MGDPRAAAAAFLKDYGCGTFDPEGREFTEKVLSALAETGAEARVFDLFYQDDFYFGRIHAAKLIRKVGCGEPDPHSSEFQAAFDNNWSVKINL